MIEDRQGRRTPALLARSRHDPRRVLQAEQDDGTFPSQFVHDVGELRTGVPGLAGQLDDPKRDTAKIFR